MDIQPLETFMPIDISKFTESTRQQIAASRAQRDPDRIGRRATAAVLGVTIRTLQRWDRDGFGPPRRNEPGKRPIWYSRSNGLHHTAIRNEWVRGSLWPSTRAATCKWTFPFRPQSPACGHEEQ